MHTLRLIASTLAVVLLTALFALPAAAETPRGDPAGEQIINGHTPAQAWPAQTSVRFTTSSGTYVCGGTLISARWVLTAAHCASNDDASALTAGAFSPVRVGSVSRSSGGHTALVDNVVRHPQYSDIALRNDLALLHLASAVPEEPLRLLAAGETSLWSAGVAATIIGWGKTETGFTSATLLEAQVAMAGDLTCLNIWGSSFSALSMLCAGGQTTDTCSGDSGGPLMVPRNGAFVLAGVTSWGTDPCGDPDYPGVYARVGAPAINAWLRSHVPAIGLSSSPTAPAPGSQATLTATVAAGAQTTTPNIAWDLDGDGAFDDATGPTASVAVAAAGAAVVGVQATYPDGDRAVARENLVAATPEPVAPPVTPPATSTPAAGPVAAPVPAPAPAPAPAQMEHVLQPPATADAIGRISVPAARMKLATLRSKGVLVRIACERDCTISGRLRHGDRAIGRAGGSLNAGGHATVIVRLSAHAKRALRGRTRITLRLTTQLRSGSKSLKSSRRIVASA